MNSLTLSRRGLREEESGVGVWVPQIPDQLSDRHSLSPVQSTFVLSKWSCCRYIASDHWQHVGAMFFDHFVHADLPCPSRQLGFWLASVADNLFDPYLESM
jgi:hypothetical protein